MVVAVALMTACDKNEFNSGKITMTTQRSGNMFFQIGSSGSITIDWGDGIKETHKINAFTTIDEWDAHSSVKWIYRHTYSESSIHEIIITGENITHLYCCENELLTLDVSKNTKLKYLACNPNYLTELNVSGASSLSNLYCDNNQLTSLDVSSNKELKILGCHYNQLTDLDISKNTMLTNLYCLSNQLTKLDVSRNPALIMIYANRNQLTELDLSHNNSLELINCDSNQLTTEALNALFESLVENTDVRLTKTIYVRSNPGTDDCNKSIAENKGWLFIF